MFIGKMLQLYFLAAWYGHRRADQKGKGNDAMLGAAAPRTSTKLS